MTIEKLYEWALRHNVENYNLIIDSVSGDLRLLSMIDNDKKIITIRSDNKEC